MNTRSLRFQLLAWYTSLLVSAFAIVAFFIWFGLTQLLLENLRDLLTRRARQIAHICGQGGTSLETQNLRAQIATLYAPETPESNGRFVRVARLTGEVLFQSGMPADGSFDPKAIPIHASEQEQFWVHTADGQEIVIRSVRVDAEGGAILVEVGGATAPVKQSVRQLLFVLSFATPLLILIAAGGAYFLIGRALKPVIDLAQSAETITIQNLPDQLPVADTGDELADLSLALNRMITRIHNAVETNRRFIADASHELRTPLAVLQAEMENVSADRSIPLTIRDRAGSHLEEVERLSKIVQSLFALASFDCGEAEMESAVVDISRIASNTAEQVSLLAEDKQIALKCNAPEPVFAKGDPARIRQVVVNLLDNAIKYTPDGGTIQVSVRRDGDQPVLEVTDNGIGIPQNATSRVFERFYRVDRGRSRDLGGAGLGLSIVKAICVAHQANVTVESTVGIGSTFRVVFPATPRSAND